MGKGKLAKFEDMRSYPNVFECPVVRAEEVEFKLKGRWNRDYFHNDRPVVLELGCGRGEYSVGLARMYPEKNFIGVDIKGARMWSGATEALRTGLPNVAFLRTQIEFIHCFFGAGEVSEIWITFPDPQMKKASKRLTSTYFMERYRRLLVADGVIHLKTDSNFLFTYTACMAGRNRLPVECSTADLYHTLPPGWADSEEGRILGIRTCYEQQWIERGMNIRYLRFRLPQEGVLEEPDEEIEPDDYRSYNRSRRGGGEG